jgi:hypothetical protein
LVKLKSRYIAGRGCELNTKEAVAKRILELCEERNMAINALATVSGVHYGGSLNEIELGDLYIYINYSLSL